MNIATVVEGPSDHEVIKTIVNRLLPGSHRYFPLQPIGTPIDSGDIIYGETGTGWKGVRRWCHETWLRPGSSLEVLLNGVTSDRIDLLILHLDADIVTNDDLQADNDNPLDQVNPPCPPIQETAENLRRVILDWLHRNQQTLPAQVIFMIPAQDTENWTFAALYPTDPLCSQPGYECLKQGQRNPEHPGYLLTTQNYGQRLKYKDGKVKKTRSRYQALLPFITENWNDVCGICTQAQSFSQDVLDGFHP